MNQFDKLPQIQVLEIHDNQCISKFEPSSCIGEDWLGCIIIGEDQFLWGKFSNLKTKKNTCLFTLKDLSKGRLLEIGKRYPYLDSLWGIPAELVLDPTRIWKRTRFEPSDAIQFTSDFGTAITKLVKKPLTGATIIRDGWDHEHCEICGETIGRGDQDAGFVTQVDNWVCEQCYENYVKPKSLRFIFDSLGKKAL